MESNYLIGHDFFNRDAQMLACALLGKVIRHRVGNRGQVEGRDYWRLMAS